MKINIGLTSSSEILPLIKAGADEFFCGIIPNEWRRKYERFFLSRREEYICNFANYNDLGQAISLAHKHQKNIYITFNALYYSNAIYPELQKVLKKIISLGPDGLIIADLGLLLKLKEWGINTPLILSGEFGIFNSYAIKSLERFKSIKRIIIQRYSTIQEIRSLIANFPDYEYEAFILNERCPFVGSHCFASHNLDLGDHLCFYFKDCQAKIVFRGKRSFSYFDKAYENLCVYNKRDKLLSLCKSITDDEGEKIPAHCGLCYLKDLKACGVGHLKIVSRGRTLEPKLQALSLVKKVIDGNYDQAQIKKLYSKTFMENDPEPCGSKYLCYY